VSGPFHGFEERCRLTAEPPAFDPVAFKKTTRQRWDALAEAWDRWTPVRAAWLGPVTEAMLGMARLRTGDKVVDVAAGAGEPGLTAAERVGPTGSVLATDLSSNILAFAERAARERGVQNLATRVMDAERLELEDGTFDVALSRLGIIFCPDLRQALAEMRRVLRPGGRAVVASFTTPDHNRFFAIPISVIRRRLQLPPPAPDQPGPFSLGGPGVMAEALRQAGFDDVETNIIAAPLRLPAAGECVRFQREAFGSLSQMLADASDAERVAAWAEIEQELGQLEGSEGFVAPSELIVGAGTNGTRASAAP
jgi:ubiquinone/menaquinone biosynthesis C-methylase UbiE